MKRGNWVFLLVIFLLAVSAGGARAQDGVTFDAVQVQYVFGETITFSVQIDVPAATLRSVTLFVQAEGESQTRVFQFEPHADNHYVFEFPVNQTALPPFSELTFWYGATLADGENVLSVRYHFLYEDNRFDWRVLENGRLRVHWYEGDLAFGQAALDIAADTLARMQSLVSADEASPVDVYLYASYEDLGSALGTGAPVWVGSHAYPGLSVALVAVTPGAEQRAMMEQQIPHEVMHVLIFQSTRGDYANIPIWLREGLAAQAELRPNPAYAQALETASDSHAILPLDTLCQAFPLDSGRAFLAYAESASFVRWLRETYGDAALQSLLEAYADGLGCQQASWKVFGASLDLLEYRWRQDALGEDAWRAAARAVLPYVVILLIILLTPFLQFFLIQETETE